MIVNLLNQMSHLAESSLCGTFSIIEKQEWECTLIKTKIEKLNLDIPDVNIFLSTTKENFHNSTPPPTTTFSQ